MKQIRQSISVAVTGTSHTATLTPTGDIKGMVRYATLKLPNYTNTVSTTLSVQDTDSQTVYTSSACTQNTTTVVVLPFSATSTTSPFPVMPYYTFTLTLGSAAGGATAYTVYLTMWIE
ncbi:MAG: hypothetical protein KKF33_20320 [Alphaproteobacteria bacterium]|nr:hypothetical protein [Alphaproteobacteria bacterium]